MKQMRLMLGDHLSEAEMRFMPELAALMGLHTLRTTFPITTTKPQGPGTLAIVPWMCEKGEVLARQGDFCVKKCGSQVHFSLGTEPAYAYEWFASNLPKLCGVSREKAPKGYVPVKAEGRHLPERYPGRRQGLEGLFTSGFALADRDGNGLPDDVLIRIAFPLRWDILPAVCDFAFRLGMETTALSYPLVLPEDDGISPLLRFCGEGEPEVRLAEDSSRVIVEVYGSGEPLWKFAGEFCEKFGPVNEEKTLTDLCECLKEGLRFQRVDGQLSYLDAAGSTARGKTLYSSSISDELLQYAARQWPETKVIPFHEGQCIYEHTYRLCWEYDRALELVREAAASLRAGDIVYLDAAMSESPEIRAAFAGEARRIVERTGAVLQECRVLCAYKQGYSWLTEYVVPILKTRKEKAAKIIIQYKPFAGEQTQDQSHWLDLPVRTLQELYPADEVMASLLDMPSDDIRFSRCEGEEDITYLCQAYNARGERIWEGCFQAAYAERFYLDAYPEKGVVHPATGYVRLRSDQRELFYRTNPTDLETVWELYQREILPCCRKAAIQRSGGQIRAEAQPFYSRMELEIGISEPEYPIGPRNDLLSPLDALHEDLYFVGLDYMRACGEEVGEQLDAPGIILPQIHIRPGGPAVRLSQLVPQARGPQASFVKPIPCEEVRVTRVQPGMRMTFAVHAAPDIEKVLSSYARLTEDGMTRMAALLSGRCQEAAFHMGRELCTARLGAGPALCRETRIEDINIPDDLLVGTGLYYELMEKLRGVKGITVFPAGESYLGRPIYAIRWGEDGPGYTSHVHRVNAVPTVLVVGRHHANEVSATNAIFRTLQRLCILPGADKTAQDITCIFLPVENVDGAALHEELAREHPNWKYHVARYNILGKELAEDYWKTSTSHCEAKVMTDLFFRWLPDVILDNHGVPSHEWEQQFSGYVSPMFRDFWLPRSLLYAYFWKITGEPYLWNQKLNLSLEQAVKDAQQSDTEIMRWNLILQKEYRKYACEGIPELFPAIYDRGTVNYHIDLPFHALSAYAAIGFPWITAVSFVGETADETASGKYLALCSRVQERYLLACIQKLSEAGAVWEDTVAADDAGVTVCNTRLRPIYRRKEAEK